MGNVPYSDSCVGAALPPPPNSDSRDGAHMTEQTCFVMMPFQELVPGYFDGLIEPAIHDAGLSVVRADTIYKAGPIIHQIWNYIRASAICVAELTGMNPNVLYELGIAHALGKPVVQIAQDASQLPFDLRGLRHIILTLARSDGTLSFVQVSKPHCVKPLAHQRLLLHSTTHHHSPSQLRPACHLASKPKVQKYRHLCERSRVPVSFCSQPDYWRSIWRLYCVNSAIFKEDLFIVL